MGTKWDKRLSEVEKKMGEAGQLPIGQRGPFIGWGDDAEASFKPIRERLMSEFGTIDGAEFLRLSWGTPEPKSSAI